MTPQEHIENGEEWLTAAEVAAKLQQHDRTAAFAALATAHFTAAQARQEVPGAER